MMRGAGLSIVFVGLSLSSSWGNGHATNYRALLKALYRRGHDVAFLERDVPWYADNRDLTDPDYCRLGLYAEADELRSRYGSLVRDADAVIVGSYVPGGAEVIRRILDTARGVVGFYDIDTPVTLAGLGRGGIDYLSPDLVPAFDFYLSFTAGPCLLQLAQQYGARMPTAFFCMVDPAVYRDTGDPKRWDLGYLGTYSASRQSSLERFLIEPARLLPERRFVVAGAQYPHSIDWPANVERIDHVPPHRHARFYSRLRLALNLTRADMRDSGWAPSVRLFEAAACGTPILSDRWAGLGNIFPEGEAIATVLDTSDVVRELTTFDAGRARRMAVRARAIVLARHTGDHRARQLEEVIETASHARRQQRRSKEQDHVLDASP